AMGLAEKQIVIRDAESIRPSVHIEDLVAAYVSVLEAPASSIRGQIFNCAYENRSWRSLARLVQTAVAAEIRETPIKGAMRRSYAVTSAKIEASLNFAPTRSVKHAIHDLIAWGAGKQWDDLYRSPAFDNACAEAMAYRTGHLR